MVDITIIGDINVDIINYPLKIFPEENRQVLTKRIFLSPGGSACNSAIACSRLGLKTRLIGRLGEDIFSNFVLDKLKEASVDTKIKISKKDECGLTVAITVGNSRSFITYKGTNQKLSPEDFSEDEIEGRIVSVAGFNLLENLRKYVKNIFLNAKEKGMETTLDPNWDPEEWGEKRVNEIIETLRITDIFFPDLEEGKAISYTDTPKLIVDKMLMYGPKIVCLKLGEEGCLVAKKGRGELVKPFHVKSLNATGTGDVFFAGFIRKYLEGKDIGECALFGNAAAALSTLKFGMERYPTYKDVNKFLRERGYG
ncbi:MAG: carbohydrate kinase family protein [Candidatus Aenigmatarchaeota archaeon]